MTTRLRTTFQRKGLGLAERDQDGQISGWVLDERVAPNAKLRQGDLIKFHGSQGPLREVGIVVTADCDLEQNKHARLVTLVPAISTKVILEYYLLLEDCERKRDLIERFVFRKFSIDLSLDGAVRYEMLRAAMQDGPEKTSDLSSSAAAFCLNLIDHIPVAVYRELMGYIGSRARKVDSLSQQIRSRGDLLLLPDTTVLGLEVEVVWMRHIWQVPLSDIAIRTSELAKRSGERIARLDSPFRYRLTQQMGQVFSDIGLPDMPSTIDKSLESVLNHV